MNDVVVCACICARDGVVVVGGGGDIVVLFTQLALSLEIGFSNAKFDRIGIGIGIEMRNKNIKLHATQYNIHSFIRSIRVHCICEMNLQPLHHTHKYMYSMCYRQCAVAATAAAVGTQRTAHICQT